MKRLGILCLPATWHLNPALALARRLVARGHEVTFFEPATCQSIVKAAGFLFSNLCSDENWDAGSDSERGFVNFVHVVRAYSRLALRYGSSELSRHGIQALLVDSAVPAGGTLAEHLGMPFVTLGFTSMFYPDDGVPPPICSWPPIANSADRVRCQKANSLMAELARPALDDVNLARAAWGLAPIEDIRESYSPAAIISQMPLEFDFEWPGRPPQLTYAGPLQDYGALRPVRFPWERLDGRPLVYASLGTVRNRNLLAYRIIAEGCAEHNVQLVISLGGGSTMPEDLEPLPGNALAVHYAPQLELIARSCAVISHAGMNTTMDALSAGKPIVAIPITDDQPGIAARIVRSGAGLKLSYRALSTKAVSRALGAVLNSSVYRDAAERMARLLGALSGVDIAVSAIERTLCL